jgi:hypothetical protein
MIDSQTQLRLMRLEDALRTAMAQIGTLTAQLAAATQAAYQMANTQGAPASQGRVVFGTTASSTTATVVGAGTVTFTNPYATTPGTSKACSLWFDGGSGYELITFDC